MSLNNIGDNLASEVEKANVNLDNPIDIDLPEVEGSLKNFIASLP